MISKFGLNNHESQIFFLAPTSCRPVLVERFSGRFSYFRVTFIHTLFTIFCNLHFSNIHSTALTLSIMQSQWKYNMHLTEGWKWYTRYWQGKRGNIFCSSWDYLPCQLQKVLVAPNLLSEKTCYMHHFYSAGFKVYLTEASCSIFFCQQ